MIRVTEHPSSRVLKTVTAACGTGHNIGTATSLQHGQIGIPIWPCWREVAAPDLAMLEGSSCPDLAMLEGSSCPDLAMLEGSSCTDIMTCTGGCGYSL